MEDLKGAFLFWEEMRRCVDIIAEPLGAEELAEDMQAHDYMSAPLSLQELLVQREGTDAFLDPRNALRVVRRKFGMMTLIARMASTFEQRNIIAVQLDGTMDEKEILAFARLMNVRVEGTAAEEELAFRKRLRREKLNVRTSGEGHDLNPRKHPHVLFK